MNNPLCYYTNCTQKIQIATVSHAAKIYLEQVIFPLQQILFEAPLEAQLEISMRAVSTTGHLEIGDPVLVELISCRHLEVSQISEIGDAILAA